MLFSESVQIAVTALLSNKLRSILTMLGIIIGVGAVIAMISIGMGVKQNVTNSIAKISLGQLVKELLPMYVVLFAVVLLVTYVPALSTWLPAVVGGR